MHVTILSKKRLSHFSPPIDVFEERPLYNKTSKLKFRNNVATPVLEADINLFL